MVKTTAPSTCGRSGLFRRMYICRVSFAGGRDLLWLLWSTPLRPCRSFRRLSCSPFLAQLWTFGRWPGCWYIAVQDKDFRIFSCYQPSLKFEYWYSKNINITLFCFDFINNFQNYWYLIIQIISGFVNTEGEGLSPLPYTSSSNGMLQSPHTTLTTLVARIIVLHFGHTYFLLLLLVFVFSAPGSPVAFPFPLLPVRKGSAPRFIIISSQPLLMT